MNQPIASVMEVVPVLEPEFQRYGTPKDGAFHRRYSDEFRLSSGGLCQRWRDQEHFYRWRRQSCQLNGSGFGGNDLTGATVRLGYSTGHDGTGNYRGYDDIWKRQRFGVER